MTDSAEREAKRRRLLTASDALEDATLRGLIRQIAEGSLSAEQGLNHAKSYVDSHRRPTAAAQQVDRAILRADSALGAAGRDVSDQSMRDLGRRVASGTMTAEEAIAFGIALIDEHRHRTTARVDADPGYRVGTTPELEELRLEVEAGLVTEHEALERSIAAFSVERKLRGQMPAKWLDDDLNIGDAFIRSLIHDILRGRMSSTDAIRLGLEHINSDQMNPEGTP